MRSSLVAGPPVVSCLQFPLFAAYEKSSKKFDTFMPVAWMARRVRVCHEGELQNLHHIGERKSHERWRMSNN